MPFIKGKSMEQKVMDEKNKLMLKKIKVAQTETDVEMRALHQRMANTEVQRLRA